MPPSTLRSACAGLYALIALGLLSILVRQFDADVNILTARGSAGPGEAPPALASHIHPSSPASAFASADAESKPNDNGGVSPTPFFKKARECLSNSPFFAESRVPRTQLPRNELEAHYKHLIKVTEPLRNIYVHRYAKYQGPWIEQYWINNFCCNRSLDDFGGVVPIFVQWVDMLVVLGKDYPQNIREHVLKHLRPDVIYVTVSLADAGIHMDRTRDDTWRISEVLSPLNTANVLVMSGGGYGHVTIPMLHKPRSVVEDVDFTRLDSFRFDVSFVGSIISSPVRNLAMTELKKVSSHIYYQIDRPRFASTGQNDTTELVGAFYKGEKWLAVMNETMLHLAPRGFGRTSYHLSEIIQMGFVPLYLYDDHEWLPYNKLSPAAVQSFGYSVQIDAFGEWARQYQKIPRSLRLDDIAKRRQNMLKHVQSHWTYDGVMQQIAYFLAMDPRSDLVCRRHPFYFDFDRYKYGGIKDPKKMAG